MSKYQVSLNNENPLTRLVEVTPNGGDLTDGFTLIGTFDHEETTDPLGPTINHVVYHHVQELLYQIKNVEPPEGGFWPENITDMQSVSISLVRNIAVESVSVTPTELELEVDDVEQLVATVTPTDATNPAVTWTSGTPAVATVSATGEVTAVSAGTSVITAKTTDGNKTATCNVTVT